jgi:hypothetical protein
VVLRFAFALLGLLFTLTVTAETLPKDYFLYPADTEIDFLLGNRNSVSVNYARKLIGKCDDGSVDPKYADLCRAADWIRHYTSSVEQFPFEQLTAQVLYFGEMHLGQESKHFLAAHIDDLRRQGIGALGMEMFNSTPPGSVGSLFSRHGDARRS